MRLTIVVFFSLIVFPISLLAQQTTAGGKATTNLPPVQPNRVDTKKNEPSVPGTIETVIKEEVVTNLNPFWALQKVNTKASLRGLDVVNDSTVWISGSGGTVLRTLNGGRTWNVCKIPGGENLDLRDIHAVDEGVALVASSGQPACVYQTTDGGLTWEKNFQYNNKNAYFNSFSFWDDNNGILMSDPIDGRVLLLNTNDGGSTWQQLKSQFRPKVERGERAYAASGTNMAILPSGRLAIALGCALKNQQFQNSRILLSDNRGRDWQTAAVPMMRSRTQGIFSICFATDKHGVAVGGDYTKPEETFSNFAVTEDGGETWSTSTHGQPPRGFRSCVAFWKKGKELKFVAVGPTGTDLSTDLGNKWRRVSDKGFNVVQFSQSGKTGWAAGSQGTVARYIGN